jgi:hypothetical protein
MGANEIGRVRIELATARIRERTARVELQTARLKLASVGLGGFFAAVVLLIRL